MQTQWWAWVSDFSRPSPGGISGEQEREREPGCQIVGGTPVAFFLAAWIWQGGRLGRAVGMGAGAGVGVGLVWVRPDPHVGVGPVWVCADPGVGVCAVPGVGVY